jgi:hypothetical protein
MKVMQARACRHISANPVFAGRQITERCSASITYITFITFITAVTVTPSTLSNDGTLVSQVRFAYTDTGPEHELMTIDSALNRARGGCLERHRKF